MNNIIGILIPLLGTVLGASMVFFMKDKLSKKVEKMLLGFASGVMLAASIWSLIIPSIEMSKEQNIIVWVPATIGFLFGIVFLILLDKIIVYLKKQKIGDKCTKYKLKNATMLGLAVTLHNFPEGMAVGIAFASIIAGNTNITLASAFALSIGIAIQNFPEGSIVSMPLKTENMGKFKAFLYGALSGIVEPIGAIITISLTSLVVPILPYILSFAAGAMMYVVFDDLIPESQMDNNSKIGTIGIMIGFLLMMIFDIALG